MHARSDQSGNRRILQLDTSHGRLTFGGRALIMGILNVTPDSFSDGGTYYEPAAAVVRACKMVAEGADLIDVGGESTRPGAGPVSAEEQIRRVFPVIKHARAQGVGVPISIDTRSAAVAAAALDAGADIVNDVSACMHDEAMIGLLAERNVPFVAMHMRGTPETMQNAPRYDDVVAEVAAFLEERAEALSAAGVNVDKMIVDPGIGFGKTTAHNLALLRSVSSLRRRLPLLVGTSRKRLHGEVLSQSGTASRLMGTAATVAHCALQGVDILRVHDVREMRQVVEMCHAIVNA